VCRLMLGAHMIIHPQITQPGEELVRIIEVLTELPSVRVRLSNLRSRVAFRGKQRYSQGNVHGQLLLETLLSTHLAHTSAQMLTWFVRRWTIEVTWEEAQAPLGMATQRQGHDQAMARATPALVSLSSIMTLTAHLLLENGEICVRSTAWSGKTRPTFADAIAWVRRLLWEPIHFSTSQQETDMMQIPRTLLERFTEALCYAA
jgi:hypothetical protein